MHKKSNISLLSIGFAVLIVLVVALVLSNSLRRTSHVILPADSTDTEQGTAYPTQVDGVNAVTVTPETVQAMIGSLARSDHRRTIRIEQFWSGGSGTREVTVTVEGDLQRTDETMVDGRVEHIITTPDTLYMWVDDDATIYTSPLGDFLFDQVQGIPTYEDVLTLDTDCIVSTTYESLSGVRCIYVETAADDQGYANRYWVSVDSGLLVAAERLEYETTIYRMAVVAEETLITPSTYFTLPGGTSLQA